MKTLHADLTTAQQSASATPYITAALINRARTSTVTFATTDSPNRLLSVQQADGRTGGFIFDVSEEYFISAVIRIQNNDGAYSAVDYRGYRLYLNLGFSTGSGNRTAPNAAPHYIVQQRFLSEEGVDILELRAVSMWEYLRLKLVNGRAASNIEYNHPDKADTVATVAQILQNTLGGSLPLTIKRDDGGVFTTLDPTVDIDGDGDREYFAFDEAPLPATPVANDALYLGLDVTYDRISIHVRTATTGTTLLWEYYNGVTWVTLNATDNTASLIVGGFHVVSFDKPTDWATTTVDGAGPYYYVRARVTAVSAPSAGTIGLIFLGHDIAFTLDTSDAGQGDTETPTIITNPESNVAQVVEAAIDASLLGLYIRDDGFHAKYIDPAESTPSYTYDLSGAHEFYVHSETTAVLVPNTIIVTPLDPAIGVAPGFTGSAENAASVAMIGSVERVVVDDQVANATEANAKAQLILDNLIRNLGVGEAEVPVNVGQEPWDYIRIVDGRTTRTTNGRVSQLVWYYEPGIYRLRVIMGGGSRRVAGIPSEALSYSLPLIVPDPIGSEVPLPPAVATEHVVAPMVRFYFADEALAVTDAVYLSSAGGVSKLTQAEASKVIGVARYAVALGGIAEIIVYGPATVTADAAVAVGALITAAATAGRVITLTTSGVTDVPNDPLAGGTTLVGADDHLHTTTGVTGTGNAGTSAHTHGTTGSPSAQTEVATGTHTHTQVATGGPSATQSVGTNIHQHGTTTTESDPGDPHTHTVDNSPDSTVSVGDATHTHTNSNTAGPSAFTNVASSGHTHAVSEIPSASIAVATSTHTHTISTPTEFTEVATETHTHDTTASLGTILGKAETGAGGAGSAFTVFVTLS